jgi:hypothetical protein
MINVYVIPVGEREEKIPLGTCRHRLEDNIKMDVKGMGCEVVDRISLT